MKGPPEAILIHPDYNGKCSPYNCILVANSPHDYTSAKKQCLLLGADGWHWQV
jgi:hypothetical protein